MLRHKEPYVLYHDLLGFWPNDIHLYEVACLHSSSSICEQGKRINNERLEFLGDAILDAIVADILFHRFGNHKEGFLFIPPLECDSDAVVDGKSVVCASEQLSVSQ